MPEEVVLLHGFAGTHRTWERVVPLLSAERYRPHALDLPGHGAARDVRPITFASCTAHVLDAAPARFALCGYSMGGRIALQIALAAPERLTRLVLVSCSPGIEDDSARAARRAADEDLAEGLERAPFEAFIERWRTQPLFAADPPEVADRARADMRRNTPSALAAVLRGIGAGQMSPLLSRLGELQMPLTVVVGERDEKFVGIARAVVAAVPDARLEILPGGHALALESPEALAAVLGY